MDSTTINNVQKILANLPFYHQLAFAYFLSLRLFPNYVAFYKKENWGNPDMLKKAIDVLKKVIVSKTELKEDVKNITEQLEKVTPDTDDFDSFLTSLALDACASVLEGLAFSQDKDNQRIQDICNSALDLTQMYIEFRDNTDYDDYSFNDPLFIEELNFQLFVVELLEKQKIIDKAFLNESKIKKSKLGELITGINIDNLTSNIIADNNRLIVSDVQFDKEIQEWIKKDNINLRELIPELVKNFYQTMKKVQNKAAL